MKKLITLLLSLSFMAAANATLLGFDFEDRNYQVGENVAVNIVVSEIENDRFGLQRVLSELAIEFSFNDTVLNFTSLVFGSALNLGIADNSTQFSENVGNLVAFDEFSKVAANSLFSAQSALDKLVLATINFNIGAVGSSSFSFQNTELYDDSGSDFTNISTAGRTLNVVAAQVPAPSVLALFLVAGIALIARKKNISK